MLKDKISEGFVIGFIGFALLLVLVAALITFCKSAFAQTPEWFERCKPYESDVKQILVQYDLSTDYFYLMASESRCKQNAKSSKGARGLWQLMPYTAKYYGCYYPENIECSTRAASRYLQHLESYFDNFDDVIAAYNMGGHNLKKYGMTKEAKHLVYKVKRLIHDAKGNDDE